MNKQELLKLIKDDNISVTTLNKGKAYIIYIECGDRDLDTTHKVMTNVKGAFERLGFKDIIFAPMRNGVKSLEVEEQVKKVTKRGKKV